MCASRGTCMQASRPPYVYVACQELLMDVLFTQAEQYLSNLTASHFGILNTKFANQNMLERILVAMHNENKADWNGNFRICVEETIAHLYNCLASIGLYRKPFLSTCFYVGRQYKKEMHKTRGSSEITYRKTPAHNWVTIIFASINYT